MQKIELDKREFNAIQLADNDELNMLKNSCLKCKSELYNF